MSKKLFILVVAACMSMLAVPSCSQIQQERASMASKVEDLELNKVYRVDDFEFTVQAVEIRKECIPYVVDERRQDLILLVLNLKQGDFDKFVQSDTYLVGTRGKKIADGVKLHRSPEVKPLFAVPVSSRQFRFSINGLELNLEKVLNETKPIYSDVRSLNPHFPFMRLK